VINADGANLALANTAPGGIWVAQSTRSMQLKLIGSGEHIKAARTLPWMNFRLLECFDLFDSNWIEVTNI
jgi:hypothetical protein